MREDRGNRGVGGCGEGETDHLGVLGSCCSRDEGSNLGKQPHPANSLPTECIKGISRVREATILAETSRKRNFPEGTCACPRGDQR